MRIGFITVNDKPTHPLANGGTEVFVSELASALVRRGHEVVIYATGNSNVQGAQLKSVAKQSVADIQMEMSKKYKCDLGWDTRQHLSTILYLKSFVQAKKDEDKIDIFHENTGSVYTGALLELLEKPVVATLHMPISETYEYEELNQYVTNEHIHYVAVSDYQKQYFSVAKNRIYNGINFEAFQQDEYQDEDVYHWIGRLDPETPKGLDDAIQVTTELGRNLEYVGFIEDMEYYRQRIEPLLNENIKSIPQFCNMKEKVRFFTHAKATVLPIKCEESFGLTFAESMAAGTPVIAYARGAALEVIEDGVTGFLVNPSNEDIRGEWLIKETGIEGIKAAIKKLESLNKESYLKMRKDCKKRVRENFTIEIMAEQYEKLYEQIINETNS